jgi:hypothetical protein
VSEIRKVLHRSIPTANDGKTLFHEVFSKTDANSWLTSAIAVPPSIIMAQTNYLTKDRNFMGADLNFNKASSYFEQI